MKKLVSLFTLLMILTMSGLGSFATTTTVTVSKNDMLHFRDTVSKLGYKIEYDKSLNMISVSFPKAVFTIPLNNKKSIAYLNGESFVANWKMIDGSLYVPRTVFNRLGFTIDHKGNVKTAEAKNVTFKERFFDAEMKDVEELELKVEKLYTDLRKIPSTQDKSYWIVGDVIHEDNNILVVEGQAFGFGPGMVKHGILKIKKPIEGNTSLGMANVFAKYDGSEFSNAYGTVYNYSYNKPKNDPYKSKRESLQKQIVSLEKEIEKFSDGPIFEVDIMHYKRSFMQDERVSVVIPKDTLFEETLNLWTLLKFQKTDDSNPYISLRALETDIADSEFNYHVGKIGEYNVYSTAVYLQDERASLDFKLIHETLGDTLPLYLKGFYVYSEGTSNDVSKEELKVLTEGMENFVKFIKLFPVEK